MGTVCLNELSVAAIRQGARLPRSGNDANLSGWPTRTRIVRWLRLIALLLALISNTFADDSRAWLEPMRKVHAKFTGEKGTFACFGDSITVTMAFWAPLKWDHKNLNPEADKAYMLVSEHMQDKCWRDWKGPEFGSNGGMTIRWARDNVDAWLKKLNPEVALVMFGTNDLGGVPLDEYGKKTREVVQRCLDNGTVVILSTIPPRHGMFEKSQQYAEAVRKIGRDLNVPVADYFAEIVKRRPEDWNGALEKFKATPGDEYQVPTLIARDGVHPSNPSRFASDYSEEGLRSNGYVLRNYVTMMAYADVIRGVVKQ